MKKKGEVLFLNNFDNNTTKNDLGKTTWCFKKGEGVCIDSFYYDINIPYTYNDRNGEYSLRLSFDVSKSGDVSGFSSDLKGVDLSGYQYLSFWVRGMDGGEIFKVRISDGVKTSEISIKGFFPKGLFPYWRRVVIPLKIFKSIKKWNEIKGPLSFVFDYKACPVRQGVIYIDEIIFE